MSDRALSQMLALATRLAGDVTAMALPKLGQVTANRKADSSVVTEVDLAAQAHILGAIAERYPKDAVRAEESPQESVAHADPLTARYCWIVDPIDGTRNFVSGFPCFATSIAVLDRGRPVVAVVLEHNLGYCYTAALGQGARLNGRLLTIREIPAPEDVLVGVPSSKDRLTVAVLRKWSAERGLICRNTGSTALHLAMVASGSLGATFSKRCKIWDIAAGALLVTEAGGTITDVAGEVRIPFDLGADPDADLPILAAAPGVHARLLESIGEIGT